MYREGRQRPDGEQHLPRALSPGDVVVLDNLSSYKVKGGIEVIAVVGAEISYLPPYSPERNPIELAFNFKEPTRCSTRRTVESDLRGQVLDLFSEHGCRNYLAY